MTSAQKAAQITSVPRPTLVLTTSHVDAQVLGALIPGAAVRAADEPIAETLARCPDDGILIAAGAWSGLDTPRLRWKSVVLPKAPYGPPIELNGQQLTHYIDSRVVAIRRINQGLHRGLRSPDASCELVLQDPRCSRSELREAIPERFKVDWVRLDEGGRREVTLSEAERNPAVRKMALAHYGALCSWNGCSVTGLHLLEVHHRDPISEGKRRTTLADLVVLCRNHHAEEHFRMKTAAISETQSPISAAPSIG
jgi:5-methylcytosine-specific restriction endonuclease McrA